MAKRQRRPARGKPALREDRPLSPPPVASPSPLTTVSDRRRFEVTLSAIAIVAFLLRAIVARSIDGLPISRNPTYDSLEYLSWARHIAAGDFTWPPSAPHGPGYPFFLALALMVAQGSMLGVRVVQAIVGAGTVVFTALTASALFGKRAAISAAILITVYAPLIWIDVSILAEGLLICALAASMWCVARERAYAAAGLVGLAALIRPTSLIFLLLVVLFATRAWTVRFLSVAIAVAVILPATLANARATHVLIPVQAYGGLNFYLGNSPSRDGLASARPGGDWERIEPAAARAGVHDVAEEDRYFIRRTLSEIRQSPAAFAGLLARKILWTFQSEEVRDTNSFYWFQQFSGWLRWLPPFTVLFALGSAGMLSLRRGARRTWIPAVSVLLAAITCIGLVVGSRYRMPMVPGLAVLGGAAIAMLLQERRPRRIALLVSIALTSAGCTRIWHHAPSHNFAEEWSLTAQSLLKDGMQQAAEVAAREAVSADRTNALGWEALGSVDATAGRRPEARQALMKATMLNPDFAKAHILLGRLSAEEGDLARSAAEYERAAEIDPRDVDSQMAAARTEGALGRPERGLALAQAAARRREPDAGEWMTVAFLAIDAGKLDDAAAALARATAAGAPSMQTEFGRALLLFRQGLLDQAERVVTELLAAHPDFAEAVRLRSTIEAARRH